MRSMTAASPTSCCSPASLVHGCSSAPDGRTPASRRCSWAASSGSGAGCRRVSVTLAGEECVWLCRLGQMPAALELARAQDFDRAIHPQYGMVADKAARVAPRLLMGEQPEMAIAQLGQALVRATEKGFHHRRVELLILHAAALLRCGRTAEALQSWRIAIELGERFGYRRVFLDDPDIVTTLNHAARGHEGIKLPPWLKAFTGQAGLQARRGADPQGAAHPQAPGDRRLESRDRRLAVRVGRHAEVAPAQRLSQARVQESLGGDCRGTPPGPAVMTSGLRGVRLL